MEIPTTAYYQRLMGGMIRGMLHQDYPEHELFRKHLEDLGEEDYEVLMRLGEHHGLQISSFQRLPVLPDTMRVLDIIRGIAPDNLLDVGTGRGTFIWRLLDEYRNMSVTAVDQDSERVNMIAAVSKGGIHNLSSQQADISQMGNFPFNAFDVTTALKVLEYIPNLEKAISELFRVTKRFIIVQYPIGDTNNPDHQTILKKDDLIDLFRKHDPMQLKCETVSNYHLLVIRK